MRMWTLLCLLIIAGSGIPETVSGAQNNQAADEPERLAVETNADAIVRDEQGVLRHLRYQDYSVNAASLGVGDATPRLLANAYLRKNAAAFSLMDEWLTLDEYVPRNAWTDAPTKIQFVQAKTLGNATVVAFLQTHFDLPIWDAGISVTVVDKERPYIISVTNSASAVVDIRKPDGAFQFPIRLPTEAELGAALGVDPARLKVNISRLIIYRYQAKQRILPQPDGIQPTNMKVPTLPLNPVPDAIQENDLRVVNDVVFQLPVELFGNVNWRVFIDVKTGSVLYLRSGVAFATGTVFRSDPITVSGDAAMTPLAAIADLNRLRSTPLALPGLAPPVGGRQSLTSTANEYVTVADLGSPPRVPMTEKPSPFEFHDSVESDGFAAVNAYYHTDAAFRLVQSFGIDVKALFADTDFPVPVDHRSLDGGCGAVTRENAHYVGCAGFLFGLAGGGAPIGIGADWRIVLHEFCHAILLNSTHKLTLPFAEGGGDSLAAILNAPGSHAPDPGQTFPWVFPERRHDRLVSDGWSWGGIHDTSGRYIEYDREQILSSSNFRMYRAIGGDDPLKPNQSLAARYGANLIVRGLGSLTPYTPANRPEILESALITADKGTSAFDGHPGGAMHKVIRWAFEKQGLHRPVGQPTNTEGAPPTVDVYIDDGRQGNYLPYLIDWTKTADIWNRVCPDGGCMHQVPARCRWNYLYVRVKNRGTQTAKGVSVRVYNQIPGTRLLWPSGMQPMATAVLPSASDPQISIPPGGVCVVGPFAWQPTTDEDQIVAAASANGDMSNIDPGSPLPVNSGPTSLARLVPFDNNLAQRHVQSQFYRVVRGKPRRSGHR